MILTGRQSAEHLTQQCDDHLERCQRVGREHATEREHEVGQELQLGEQRAPPGQRREGAGRGVTVGGGGQRGRRSGQGNLGNSEELIQRHASGQALGKWSKTNNVKIKIWWSC